MREELLSAGHDVDVVAINGIGGEASQSLLAARCTFDLLQDVAEVGAWSLMGGNKDDFFIYREGGRLAPGGYLPIGGERSTVLSTPEGYDNVLQAIIAADELGPSDPCDVAPLVGSRLPGDANSDALLDVADAIALLDRLFGDDDAPLPCDAEGTRVLLDVNGDGELDISDAIYTLLYLYVGGDAPAAGTGCTPIAGCPDACPR